ncbi:DUF1642 domain-containing protein [Lactococcus lactis]|nr:DUF1642 domain-containing protein [Lactococcus lactis]
MDLKEVPMYFTQSGCSMTRKTYIEMNWIFDNYKNWHSDEEFQDLKSQLQQQALPVVPEDVDKAIKYLKKHNTTTFSDFGDILTEKGFSWLNDFQFKDRRFGFGGLNNKLFILSHLAITGYQVEKPQLFYLKNKLTGLWLMRDEVDKVYPYDHTTHIGDRDKFTQQEIDSMETGSYEQIEVTE